MLLKVVTNSKNEVAFKIQGHYRHFTSKNLKNTQKMETLTLEKNMLLKVATNSKDKAVFKIQGHYRLQPLSIKNCLLVSTGVYWCLLVSTAVTI
jgi:hypothetical protein